MDQSSTRDLARPLWRTLAVLAALFCLAAILAHPSIVGRLLVPDGRITHRGPLYVVELALLATSGLTAFASWRVSRARRPIHARTLLAAVIIMTITLLACALVSEIVVRITMPVRRVLVPNSDAWWEHRWRLEHDPADSLLTREKYGYDVFDPELGWIPRPGYAARGVVVNADGIRATSRYSRVRATGTRRIVIVGDSYTWGENMTNAHTYAAQMESLATGTEIVNLGVHGYGTDQQLLRLRRDGFPLRPDVVVLAIFGQNINRNVLSFRDYAKPRFRLRDGDLILDTAEIPSPETLLSRPQKLPALRFVSLTKRAVANVRARTRLFDISSSEKWRVTEALLRTAWKESEAAGASFLLVYVPWRVHAEPLPLERPIAAWAETSAVPFLNLREAFTRLPRDEWERLYGGHWTALGHRRAAEAIVSYLERSGF